MDIRDAIEILMDIQSDWEDGEEYETFNLAIKALEKQIPKQVQYLDRNEGYFECGACKGAIYNSSDDLEDHIYCLLCGQRVDMENYELKKNIFKDNELEYYMKIIDIEEVEDELNREFDMDSIIVKRAMRVVRDCILDKED